MLLLAIKKIINNRILMLSLFAGILVAILITCTIPIYSQGISHRMLVTKLENFQNENDISPGAVIISCSLASFGQQGDEDIVDKFDSSANLNNYNYCTDYLEDYLYKKLYMPSLVESITISSSSMKAADHRDQKHSTVSDVVVKATNTYKNAFEIKEGRMPNNTLDSNGCMEVVISKTTQENCVLPLGTILNIGNTVESTSPNSSDTRLKVVVVGIFEYKTDPLNPIIDKDTGNELYCDFELFFEHAFKEKNIASRATWYFAGDYTKFDLEKTEETIEALDGLNNNLRSWGLSTNAKTTVPPISEYTSYYDNVKSVNVLLALFYSPVLILIVFFIFMISKFVVENDKNEIAMLNSRGSSRIQIILLYFLQGGTIALVCLAIAPVLALLLCKMLGTTSGFLEFSQRAPLRSSISLSAIMFGVVAAILAILTMLIPVYRASKIEIIQHKRKVKKGVIGTIALAITTVVLGILSAYSYYNLVYQQEGLITANGGIQPLAYIFLISMFATVALLFVLVYPFILKFILKIGQRSWTPSVYSAFSKISKLEGKEKFIVIFLTLTIAIGAFASVSARTLNKNFDNSTQYRYPCDVIADIKIYSNPGSNVINRRFIFDDAEGIQATKVVRGNEPRINTYLESITENVELLAIEPKEFGKIVSWDDSILKHPLDYYLDMLDEDMYTCILSTNAAKLLGVDVGGMVHVHPDKDLKNNVVVSAKVIAIVDAWPAYYSTKTNSAGIEKDNYLCVVNINAVDKVAGNQQYSVWMNTDEDYTSSELKMLTVSLGATADKAEDRISARMNNIVNGARERYLSSIDSNRQATNGSLTLGFIAIIFVCAIGLIIYWMISIKSRTLQIGTMRALGMSFRDVSEMILWEQMLLCFASVIIGIVSGLLSGVLFAPLLQSAFGQMGQMPPYEVAFSFVDIIKLLVLIIILICVSLGAGTIMLKRIKAATAIKLGEE
jgi:putative ABC transport system permease protein